MSGAAALTHELLLHSSPEEMLAFVVPFVRDGIAAEEPTLLMLRPETAATVLPLVPSSPHLVLLPAMGRSGHAPAELREAGDLLTGYGTAGARVRMLNEQPIVPDAQWPQWRRLEAAVNLVLARHRAWLVCGYDRRPLTAERVADLEATHPQVGRADRHSANTGYRDPVEFAAAHRDDPPDPVETTEPAAQLVDPSPAAARAAVAGFARHSRLPATDVENVVLAANEAVANARLHGRPPVVMRIWAGDGSLTVTVTDTGPGPSDPFAGLLPPDPGQGYGLGLWLSHQLVDVAHRRHADGYTVRLSAARRAL